MATPSRMGVLLCCHFKSGFVVQEAVMFMLSTLLPVKKSAISYILKVGMVNFNTSNFLAPPHRIRGRDPVLENRPRTNKVNGVQVFIGSYGLCPTTSDFPFGVTRLSFATNASSTPRKPLEQHSNGLTFLCCRLFGLVATRLRS